MMSSKLLKIHKKAYFEAIDIFKFLIYNVKEGKERGYFYEA